LLSFIFEKPNLSRISGGITSVLYAGIISSGIGYTLQISGQKRVNSTVAALILSLESVISAIAGYIAWRLGILGGNQSLTARQITGCLLVFTAVIFIQLPNRFIPAEIFKIKLRKED
jgi:drug/metabolite transporter (DMT)-like permease